MRTIFNSGIKLGPLLSPQPCLLCGAFSADGVCCKACVADLPRLGLGHCPVCGLPAVNGNICGRCLKQAPHFDATVAAFAYAFPLDKLIQAAKFSAQFALLDLLSTELAKKITTRPDHLVAMPLHPRRLRERGYNQSHILAQQLAKKLNLPLYPHICERTLNTLPQSSLAWQARRKNMRGAFTCSANLSRQHIAIVDDVMTSGASIGELARVLKNAGAVKVSAWVLARTLPH